MKGEKKEWKGYYIVKNELYSFFQMLKSKKIFKIEIELIII